MYFDLHVPGAEHYLADGIWHHNTGKTRTLLEKIHRCCLKVPGTRALLVRKTHASLTATALVTFREQVLHHEDHVSFFGGNREEPAQYRYPNGSVIVVGGMDKAVKVMSSEYDLAAFFECTEAETEDWEALLTRLRRGVMPYQQLMGDCNPDAPSHWLKLRADAGQLRMLESRIEDNPRFWGDGAPTPEGAAYIAKLDALTGVRYKRLRLGQWVAAEGQVFEGWDRAKHLIDWFDPPKDWVRYWSVDFGYTHPFVWQAWAEDHDGRLFRYREIHMTKRLVEDHARDILRITENDPAPTAIICDHDAEDRATLERHLDMPTSPAKKDVSPGIQAVASRLKTAGDGYPRIFLMRDALVERDEEAADAKKPVCTEEEFEGYVWNRSAGRLKGEEPLKQDDDGMDCTRYVVFTLEDYRPLEAW